MLDSLYTIALFVDFRTTVDIMSICSGMWRERRRLFEEKHMMIVGRKMVDIWSVEKNYYVGTHEFIIFANKYTGGIELSKIYEYNNLGEKIKNDIFNFGVDLKFNIIDIVLVIYYVREGKYDESYWNYKFYSRQDEIKNDMIDMSLDNYGIDYAIIDLTKTDVSFWKYKSNPKMDSIYCYTFKDNSGKIIWNSF